MKTNRFKIRVTPSWDRMIARIPVMTKRVQKGLDKLGDDLADEYLTRLKENAPAFSTFLKESIDIVKVMRKTRPAEWYVTVGAPYARFQEEGVFPHFVSRNSLSYAGYTFGDWMDAHGFSGGGMWVGLSNTKLGTENAFINRSILEMNPVVNKRIERFFNEVKSETNKK